MKFADVLRLRRRQRGFTQAALAAAVGLHPRQIARYEAGNGEPTLPTAVALASILDVPLTRLAGLDGVPDLDGTWQGATEALADQDHPVIVDFDVDVAQDDTTLSLRARPRDAERVDTWKARLQLNDDGTLPGTFTVTAPIKATGTVFFTLDADQEALMGRWVTANADHHIASGCLALTRNTTADPRVLLDQLLHLPSGA